MEPVEMAASQNRAYSNISIDDKAELLDEDIEKIDQGKEQETFEEALAQMFKGNQLELDKNERILISIRRRKLWRDAVVKLSKFTNEDLSKALFVNFIGEDGADCGGLTREFFPAVYEKVSIISQNNQEELEKLEYEIFGKIISLALSSG